MSLIQSMDEWVDMGLRCSYVHYDVLIFFFFFFFIFHRILRFMRIRGNLHEMSNPVFLENYENITNLSSELAKKVKKVKFTFFPHAILKT